MEENELLEVIKVAYSTMERIRNRLEEGTSYSEIMEELKYTERILQEKIDAYGERESTERPRDSLDVEAVIPFGDEGKLF